MPKKQENDSDIIYWWRNHRILTPKFGLIIGAVSGAGFGVFEAILKLT